MKANRNAAATLIAQTATASGWPGAAAQLVNADTAMITGDLPQAEYQITHALARFRSLGDRWGQADSLANLAGLAEIHGQYSEALHALDEATELTKRLGNTDQTIRLLAKAGNILFLTGDYPAARSRHEEALRLAEQRGPQSEIAFIHNGMGLSARRQGELHRARTHHGQALTIYQRGRALDGIAYTQACLGYTAELDGDADQAEAHHLQSLAIAYQTGDPRAIAFAVEGLAGAAALRHDHRRCAILLGAATAMRSSAGAPLPPAERFDVDRAADAARSHLGDKGFDLAFHEGAAMTPDGAYNYASWSKSTLEPPAS